MLFRSENRGLNYALIEGYHNSLMKGRYPVCCLFLEIDPAAVDVNIHPAKREVKFHREFEIRKYVAQAVRETLVAFHGEPPKPPENSFIPKPSTPNEIKLAAAAATPALPQFPEQLKPATVPPTISAQQSPLKMGFTPRPTEAATAAPVPQSAIGNQQSAISPPTAARPAPLTSPGSAVPLLDVPMRLVGVIGRLYVILESDRGLVLLDQHAAHERILFEQMMTRIESNALEIGRAHV